MSDQIALLPILHPPFRQLGAPGSPCGGRSTWDRFWSKVDRSGGADACWPWTGARRRGKNEDYGRFVVTVGPRRVRVRPAHRIAWELTNGPIPDGTDIRHLICDNPPCCNPAHLEPGTHTENIADMDRKGRRVPALGDRNGARRHPESRRGERNAASRLTETDVRLVLSTPRDYGSSVRLARELGVSASAVRRIRYGTSWRHVA
jgi:hypothetical protein